MIVAVSYEVSAEAVVVQSRAPLTVLSSAVAGGGLGRARSIVNLHVPRNWAPAGHGAVGPWEAALADFASRRGLPVPVVGLATSAWTERAAVAREEEAGIEVLLLASVGLGNPTAAGISRRGVAAASTINIIAVVEAQLPPAALVNLVITVTEVKTAVLGAAGVRSPDGAPATGTSTDAVVVAATGRGRVCDFGGPISDAGAVTARAARRALERGVQAWLGGRARPGQPQPAPGPEPRGRGHASE
jgi:iron complex transport system ATP-binding protein